MNEKENSANYDGAGNSDSKWKLNYEKEIQFWDKIVLKDLIYK